MVVFLERTRSGALRANYQKPSHIRVCYNTNTWTISIKGIKYSGKIGVDCLPAQTGKHSVIGIYNLENKKDVGCMIHTIATESKEPKHLQPASYP